MDDKPEPIVSMILSRINKTSDINKDPTNEVLESFHSCKTLPLIM